MNSNTISAAQQLAEYVGYIKDHTFHHNALLDLIQLFQHIRPKKNRNYLYVESQLALLTKLLSEDEDALTAFRAMFKTAFLNSSISEILLKSGIPRETSFFAELNAKIHRKILPELQDKGSFLYAIDSIFYKTDDHKWVNGIDPKFWTEFISLFNFELNLTDKKSIGQFMYPLHILSCQITCLAADKHIVNRIKDEALQSFLIQNDLCTHLLSILKSESYAETDIIAVRKDILLHLKICDAQLDALNLMRSDKGSSLQMSYLIDRTQKQINRMRLILDLIYQPTSNDITLLLNNIKRIITNENTKNSIRRYLRENAQELAYQVSEHVHNTGEHYITTDKPSYFKMFKSAMSGGLVIAFLTIIKNLLHLIVMAPFWQAFTYSLNYASGFVLIHATGGTLATKQPAMTASTIAGSLDKTRNEQSPSTAQLAIVMSQVLRSQTASFAGNLCIAFPVSLFLAYLWSWIMGYNIVDPDHALGILHDNNPIKSLSIVYACYTGVFLYLAGIISGYFDNYIIFSNIPQRLREHPMLKRKFSISFVDRAVNYFTNNVGLIMGNVILGFMLGFAGFFGSIFGLNFDVRHVTLASGNLAVALQGLGFDVAPAEWMWTLAGVIIIGFFNFSVSFSLAFVTALISRRIKFAECKQFLRYLWKLFIQYPLDFIWPPITNRQPTDFIKSNFQNK